MNRVSDPTPDAEATQSAFLGRMKAMETTPRDGTPILMCLERPSKQAVAYGAAPEVQVVCGDLDGPGDELIGPTGEIVTATHWVPLPLSPEQSNE